MDAQKKHGKALFGSGFIASDKVAAVVAAAKEEAAKVEANKKSRDIVWELSEREKEIIKSLEFD
jgi:hypothetical protein